MMKNRHSRKILKQVQNDYSHKIEFSQFQKILLSIIVGLILVIIVGTIISVIKKSTTPTEKELLSQGKAINLNAPVDTSEIAYYELGRIRIITKNQNNDDVGTVLVVSPYLAYPVGDTVFYEELARKRGVIKGFFQNYFATRTKNELLSETEEIIEKKLLAQINEQLSLGQISDIYFTDYIFLE